MTSIANSSRDTGRACRCATIATADFPPWQSADGAREEGCETETAHRTGTTGSAVQSCGFLYSSAFSP